MKKFNFRNVKCLDFLDKHPNITKPRSLADVHKYVTKDDQEPL